jgi:hypothetical protein
MGKNSFTKSIQSTVKHASHEVQHTTAQVVAPVQQVQQQVVQQVQQTVVAPMQQVAQQVAPVVEHVAVQAVKPANYVEAVTVAAKYTVIDPVNNIASISDKAMSTALNKIEGNIIDPATSSIHGQINTATHKVKSAVNTTQSFANHQVQHVEDITKKYLKDFNKSLPKIMGASKNVGEKIRDVASVIDLADEAMTILPYVGAGLGILILYKIMR